MQMNAAYTTMDIRQRYWFWMILALVFFKAPGRPRGCSWTAVLWAENIFLWQGHGYGFTTNRGLHLTCQMPWIRTPRLIEIFHCDRSSQQAPSFSRPHKRFSLCNLHEDPLMGEYMWIPTIYINLHQFTIMISYIYIYIYIYSLRHSAGPLAYCRFVGCRRLLWAKCRCVKAGLV